ncbi:cobalt ABC transporter permease [Pseudoroseicyclus tamaricis]|nr:cobalt ABC transporter permease [Pseudoroseicyclus tamaricis]
MRAVLTALALLAGSPALAHNLILEAYVVGDGIEGEAFFSDGTMVGNAEIEVLGPDGAELGRTVADGGGAFRYMPSAAVDHVFRLDAGSGHVVDALVAAADLPAGLAAAEAGAETAALAPAPAAPAAETDEALAAAIDTAVARELAPLMTQLAAYRQRTDLMNLVSGIGILCGLVGLGLFLAGARMIRDLPRPTPTPLREAHA